MSVKRAITDLKLEAANDGKLDKLDVVADEYMFVVECYARHIIGLAAHPAGWGQPPQGAHAFHPKQQCLPPLLTTLSERWKRCAWMQACGVVRSWLSNGRHLDGSDDPSFEGITIQGNANVIVLSKANGPRFDWWLRISTVGFRDVIHVPFDMHPYGARVMRQALGSGGKLSSGVLIRKREGVWSAQLCVTEKVPRRKAKGRRGVDMGMVRILADSRGSSYGTLTKPLLERLKVGTGRMRGKQKLNACLRKKNLATVSLADGRTERWVRNEAGRAINQFVGELEADPLPPAVVLEKLSVADMRFKSRENNRMLKAGQIGYISRLTRYRLDLAGLPWEEINPAHTSQECPLCGFTMRQNRPTQARFACLMCGFEENANTKSAVVIEGRSGDDELNTASFRNTGAILAERFMRRWRGERPPVACDYAERQSRKRRSADGSSVGDPLRRLGFPFLQRWGSPTDAPEEIPSRRA